MRLRAFGTYEIRIADPATFLREIVGTDGRFTTDEITNQLRNLIVARFAGVIASSGIPILDLAANYEQLGQFVTGRIAPEFANYGLELASSWSRTSRCRPRSSRRSTAAPRWAWSAISEIHAVPGRRGDAHGAANPGGDAGAGVGMGMGMAMAKQIGEAIAGEAAAPATPPPLRRKGLPRGA